MAACTSRIAPTHSAYPRRVHPALAAVLSSMLLVAGCSAPPRSPQQIMRETVPPTSVIVTGLPADGARVGTAVKGVEVVLGDVAIRVEEAEKATAADLTRPSVDDALAVIASSAADVGALATDVRGAAARIGEATTSGVHVGATLGASGGARVVAGTTVRFEGTAAERVRAQASAVERGAAKVAQAAEVVAGAVALARALGSILGDPNDDTRLRIAADARGVPHRATCMLREKTLQDERPRLSCTIVRADGPPTTVWHLNVGTTDPGMTDLLAPARGWFRAEPTGPTRPNLWISRPDGTVRTLGRTSLSDFTAFAVQRDATPIASLRVRDASPPAVWLARDLGGLDEEASGALSVALAILALPPWPTMKPDPKP